MYFYLTQRHYKHIYIYIYIYIYTRTIISCTVPVSVYKTVNEPIQQHTAVRYYSWLRWTAMNFCLHQTVTHFYPPVCSCCLHELC